MFKASEVVLNQEASGTHSPHFCGLPMNFTAGIGLKSMRFASVQQLSSAITACLERPEIQQKAAMLSRQLAKVPRVQRKPWEDAPKWEAH